MHTLPWQHRPLDRGADRLPVHHPRADRSRRGGVAALTLAATITLAACGSSSPTASSSSPLATPGGSSSPTTSAVVDPTLAALVPSQVRSSGPVTIGTDASYAPNEFVAPNGTTIEGMDIALGNALLARLGLTATWVNAPFDSIIPGLQSGKYRLGMSSFTDNKAREKVVDFVTYFTAGTSWAARTGNPTGITPADACGRRVAVQKGTVQVDDVTAKSAACKTAGKQPITIDQYQLQSDATTAVVSGKDEAMLADSPVVGYAVRQAGGQLELVGQSYDTAPYGIAVPKTAGTFTDALLGSLKAMIADGSYQKILATWGVESGAITTPVINGATS